MSESDSPTRGDLHHQHHHQQQQLHQSSSQHNADERDDANSSIIGKVKSRVSSIFPQTLTKWFSPSTTPTTAAATTSNGGVSRRRRRNEECEDEDYERANNSDDDSNNSAEDEEDISPALVQPPTKRSRLNVEVPRTNSMETQSFSSSTPTTAVRRRTTTATHLNLYGKQKAPAYNFTQTKITTTTNTTRSGTTTKNTTVDSADIIEVVPERNLNTSISSRRSLNIPSTSYSEGYRSLRDLKHQPALNLRTTSSVSVSPSVSRMQQQRGGATILETAEDDNEVEEEEGQATGNATIVVEEVEEEDEDAEDDNEESEEIAKVTSKKQKFTNGNVAGRSSSVATESGDSRSSSVQAGTAKSGRFILVGRGLRTLSGNGLNFFSHLESRKSLFSEKNMPGMLNNSTLSLTSLNRRQFNSSIYGSTSALSDSRLLNTSSPFYKGQTTYGGAAAYNSFNRSLNQSVRIAPTLIRPTSSLSTLSSSSNSLAQGTDQSNSAISSTAKRILELINDFSSPLNDAKKMASNIKTPAMWANSSAAGKRFSEADLATSRSIRLSTVRTPYFRPNVTLNPNNSDSKKLLPPLKELHVPSMSQLLQMKKMLSSTERSRQIASTSKSTLNQECEYKLPGEEEAASEKAGSKHVSKIRSKVTTTTRASSKNVNLQDEEAPAPANLPNVAFPFMHSVPKIDIPLKSNLPAPAEKKDSSVVSTKGTKPTFAFEAASKPAEEAKPTPAIMKPIVNFNTGSGASKKPVASSTEFKFSSPLNMNHIPLKEDLTPINNFKFSSPVLVDKQTDAAKSAPSIAPVPKPAPQLKKGSVLDALKTTSPARDVTTASLETSASPASFKSTSASLFGPQFKKPSNEWECDACMVRNKETVDSCVACTTPRKKTVTSTPALPSFSAPLKNTFGDAFKPKSDTWECSACMVRNKNDASECVACNTKKQGASAAIAAAPAVKLQTTDAGFKSLVAQQTASKWECDACMTRNDADRNKCVCCEQAKPGTQAVTDSVPKFSFGTSGGSKFTFGFAGAMKEDELKAEASKTEHKTGFGTGILFGVKPITNSTSSPSTGKDVPDAKTNMTGFKFGVPAADSSKSDSAAVTTTTTTAAPTGFSFGIKQDAKVSSVKFTLPVTASDNKTTTSSAVLTSTAASSAATPSLFGTVTTSAASAAPKVAESSSTPAESNKALKSLVFAVPAPVASSATAPTQEPKGFVFGVPAPVSSSAPTSSSSATTSNAIKPITFGSSSTSEDNKSPPKITFGTSRLFGKPISTTEFSKSGFAFGKDQSSDALSLFGSQTASSTIADTKTTTPVFGTTAASSSAATSVSSSATPFVFGKPSITTSFGASIAATTTVTTSVFGAKPSSVFSGVSTPSSSTSASVVSSTLATSAAPTTTASSTPFVFGRDTTTSSSQSSKPFFGASPFDSASSAAPATTTSSWSTNTFTFGSSKPAEEVKSTAVPTPAFGSPAPIFGSANPIFGSTQVSEVKPTQSAPTAVPTFGASATTSLFGSNTTSAPSGSGQQPTGNLFGSTTSTPLFGSMTFGAAPAPAPAPAAVAPVAQASSNPPTATTFGSGDSSFFSGFGSLAAAAPSSTSDGASAPKKAQIGFNFGGSQASGNGGFSFGSNNNNKPADTAFKFTASSAPSFNFTGSSETTNAAQPFQFGAPTGTPAVFNFGSVEGSNSGGPFQFNAAASAVATNNIFAPLPTPGSQTVSQQARRKMRTTNRRLTPR